MNEQPMPSRILEIPPERLTPEQRAGLDALLRGRGRMLTPYKVWLHSHDLLRAMEHLGTFLNKKCSLSEREVELGICLIARHWAAEYVFRIHAARCVDLGYPAATIDAIWHDQVPDLPEPRERAVYDLAVMAQNQGPGSDLAFDSALGALGRDGLAEVICLFGYYSAVAIAMRLHRVPLPAGLVGGRQEPG